MSSIKDVADAARVSTATVSRVLSDKPHVRPEIRERVLAAVEQLNYRPNRVARSLRVQQSHIIGLIVSDIQNLRNEIQGELSSELYNALQRLFSGSELVPVSARNLENLDLLFTQISNVLTSGEGFEVFR